jgi:hypothetical protein
VPARSTAEGAASAAGQDLVEALVALPDADRTPTSMPLAIIASRSAKESHSEVEVSRVRPSPRSSSTTFSSATPSGMPSKVKVCTISSSGRTSWKQPWKPYSSPSCRCT